MPDLTAFTNPWAALAALTVFLLIGGMGGGFIISLRRDVRMAQQSDIELTALIRSVSAETIEGMKTDIESLRAEVTGLRKEISKTHVVIRVAVNYAQTLLAYIGINLPFATDVPRVPPLLEDYLADEAMLILRTPASTLDSNGN